MYYTGDFIFFQISSPGPLRGTSNLVHKLGTILYDKNAENSTIWDVIVANEITYGTNWNYVEKGTNIEGYGTTQNNWLVNYETGEIIELEEGEYTRLTHGDNIGVTDGLIFNLDPSIIVMTKAIKVIPIIVYFFSFLFYI